MDLQYSYIPSCPFCPFTDQDDTFVAEHIQYCHPEDTFERSETSYTDLATGQHQSSPRDLGPQALCHGEINKERSHACGEMIKTVERSRHLNPNTAQEVAPGNTSSDRLRSSNCVGRVKMLYDSQCNFCPLNAEDHEETCNASVEGWQREQRLSPGPSSSRRDRRQNQSLPAAGAGRAELGPHAHEKRMPSWLRKLLEQGAHKGQSNTINSDGTLSRRETIENEATNVIPVLARLCQQDPSVKRAFLCNPKTRQITKMAREGSFCGYRNIQMLISYIQESHGPAHEQFPTLPTILQLQDMIEDAWDMGFNSVGRAETGGIRGTRKYIGTPEAQAVFLSLGVLCEAESIGEAKELRAHDALYAAVAAYFRQTWSLNEDEKVVTTHLPPIYLQHQGHSLTIIGFEIRDNGSANLLVFDPMSKIPPAVRSPSKPSVMTSPDHAKILKAYRRGSSYFQKYKTFELLK
ncbi:C78 family peptidase [Aspergillus clavatus NRRL 1]|uniref:DUF1671 domain protein n=1 Tax=Aspergillus clavatus (strain ATCC 1007 / CBS 513.65 / DSM 816 / NCTC 3887 / NRRL 1 / QM 1276 / 107) TaxID=344612 RepID=A1C9Q0_ASPCL|nr:DUF1671 domain protein [Aspergillus clavatus NRRL 1]EAW12468.1 DUF1671 domain protein [Aspergillus clavatus NRRL 1]